jgi:hypothetical protein
MQGTVVPQHSYSNGVLTFTLSAEGAVTVSVAADAVMDAAGNGNEAVTKAITVIGDVPPVAVTPGVAKSLVKGGDSIVVTLSATDMLPALAAEDFAVMGGTATWSAPDLTITPTPGTADAMEGTTVLTPVWSDTAKTLTITPIGTGDTTVTINTSAAGAAKITFAAVDCDSQYEHRRCC